MRILKNRVLGFLFSIAISMCVMSCSNQIGELNIENSGIDILLHNIDSINKMFILSSNEDGVMYIMQEDNTSDPDETTTLHEEDDSSIYEADAVGFMAGMLWGGTEELIMGATLGTSIAPGVGSVSGAVVGALLAGVSTALVTSAVAAKNKNDSTTNAQTIYWGYDNWLNYSDDVIFDDELIGGNLGWYHNQIIQELWLDSLEVAPIEDLFDYALTYLQNNNILNIFDLYYCSHIMSSNWSDWLDNYQCLMDPTHQDIIDSFNSTIVQLDREDWLAYSQAIMEEISQSGVLTEQDILLLNGTISTFYYSSLLWNMDAINNIPCE